MSLDKSDATKLVARDLLAILDTRKAEAVVGLDKSTKTGCHATYLF